MSTLARPRHPTADRPLSATTRPPADRPLSGAARAPAAFAVVAGALLLAGCASGARTAGPEPEPAAGPAVVEEAEVAGRAPEGLEPSAAAVRTADRISLTGRETGTMWTFENPPLAYWDSEYGFTPGEEWLEHARLSSVRYGEICSASFVSPDGLVMTNHHCARDCAEAVSRDATDYVEEGFHAASRAEERVCPNLSLDQLVEIEEVTGAVRASVPAGAPDTAVVAAREAAMDSIREACEAGSDLTCQVVSLYHGGQHQLYKYRRLSPVKLVFIPELQAGFFGGDPDNFTYPRFTLDVAFVRAYRADGETPAETPHHFSWDPEGAEEGEVVFVTGNPGSTSRLATLSQVVYEQRYRHPFLVQLLSAQREVLREIAGRGPEAERQVRDQLFSVENSLKAFSGQLEGLRDTTLIGRKIRWEREFRDRVRASGSAAEYADAWDRMAAVQARKMRISPRLNANNIDFIGSPYIQAAGALVRWIRETSKPEAERAPEFRGEPLRQTERFLTEPMQPDPEIGGRLLRLRLEIADRWLEPDDPFRALAFRPGESPAEATRRLVRESRVTDVAFRRSLMDGGLEALRATDDPLLRLAAAMDSVHPGLAERWEEVQAAETALEERLADALFLAFGTDLPPDATFTLRISDGVVRRYPYNGTFAPPRTSFYGLYERSANFGNEMPWTLPRRFAERRDAIDMAVPLNFVSTNDITGGNSGSPMIDREGRVIGLAFDGNIEQLPNEFVFRTEAARTIGVHSAGILEALRSVYEAEGLVRELLGEPPAGADGGAGDGGGTRSGAREGGRP